MPTPLSMTVAGAVLGLLVAAIGFTVWVAFKMVDRGYYGRTIAMVGAIAYLLIKLSELCGFEPSFALGFLVVACPVVGALVGTFRHPELYQDEMACDVEPALPHRVASVRPHQPYRVVRTPLDMRL